MFVTGTRSARLHFAHLLWCAGVALAVPALASSLQAQANGAISGLVLDSAGAVIAGGQVSVAGMRTTASSDADGRFHLSDVPTGTVTLRARRLGFAPATLEVAVTRRGTANVEFRLQALATKLTPMIVRANRADFTGRLAGYYERLAQRGGGVFITREQIDRENPRMLTHLLTHVPGVTSQRMRGGGVGVRLRGRTCWPLVYLDGTAMPAGEVDLDALSPTSIHGVELYLGSTTAPIRFQHPRNMSSCGTILLWSRGPDTDPIGRQPLSAAYLERLSASLSVFTAEQVDEPARLDPLQTFEIPYPAALFAENISGSVLAEFVVDAQGQVEVGTFGIVSSSHPLFSDAVRRAIGRASYAPARKEGLGVRQIVQQPFTFTIERANRAQTPSN